jgi:hypothetical protein
MHGMQGRPVVTAGALASSTGISLPAVNNALRVLGDLGIDVGEFPYTFRTHRVVGAVAHVLASQPITRQLEQPKPGTQSGSPAEFVPHRSATSPRARTTTGSMASLLEAAEVRTIGLGAGDTAHLPPDDPAQRASALAQPVHPPRRQDAIGSNACASAVLDLPANPAHYSRTPAEGLTGQPGREYVSQGGVQAVWQADVGRMRPAHRTGACRCARRHALQVRASVAVVASHIR